MKNSPHLEKHKTLLFLQQQGNLYALRIVSHRRYNGYIEYQFEYCYTAKDYATGNFIKVYAPICLGEKSSWERVLAGLHITVLELVDDINICQSFGAFLSTLQKQHLKVLRIQCKGKRGESLHLLLDNFPLLEELSIEQSFYFHEMEIAEFLKVDEHVVFVGAFPCLRKVSLSHVRVSPHALLSCLSPDALEELSLYHCGKAYKRGESPDFAPAALSAFSRLRVLHLRCNRIRKLSFLPSFPHLEVLDIQGNPHCAVSSAVLWFPKLRILHFRRTRFVQDSYIPKGRDWVLIARYGRERLSLQEMEALYQLLVRSPFKAPSLSITQWLHFYAAIPVLSFRRLLRCIFSLRFAVDVAALYREKRVFRCSFVGKFPNIPVDWREEVLTGTKVKLATWRRADVVFIGEGVSASCIAQLLAAGKLLASEDNFKQLYANLPTLYLYHEEDALDKVLFLWRNQKTAQYALALQLLMGGGLPRRALLVLCLDIIKTIFTLDKKKYEPYKTAVFWTLMARYFLFDEYTFLQKLYHNYIKFGQKSDNLVRKSIRPSTICRFFLGEFSHLCFSIEEYQQIFYKQAKYKSGGEDQYFYLWMAERLTRHPALCRRLWMLHFCPERASVDVTWVSQLWHRPTPMPPADILQNTHRIVIIRTRSLLPYMDSMGYIWRNTSVRLCEMLCEDVETMRFWYEELHLTETPHPEDESGDRKIPCLPHNELLDGWRAEVYLRGKLMFSTDNQCNTLWFAEEEWRRKLKDGRRS